jgi:hypothetical protein
MYSDNPRCVAAATVLSCLQIKWKATTHGVRTERGSEDGGNMVLRNVDILTIRRHNPEEMDMNLHPEDGSSMDLRNVGILPQHYTES